MSDVASSTARVAVATSRPASLLTLHLAFARFARISGAEVADFDDATPMRVDGRADRRLRWVDGVAVVTDGESLCALHGPEAAQEWLFMIPRPALVVADGPYAEVAADAGIEVVAFAGLDHSSLAFPATPRRRCLVVPMWTDRPRRRTGRCSSTRSRAAAAPKPPRSRRPDRWARSRRAGARTRSVTSQAPRELTLDNTAPNDVPSLKRVEQGVTAWATD